MSGLMTDLQKETKETKSGPQSQPPECERWKWKGHCGDGDWQEVVPFHVAQAIERQRDEAREKLLQVSGKLEKYEIEHATICYTCLTPSNEVIPPTVAELTQQWEAFHKDPATAPYPRTFHHLAITLERQRDQWKKMAERVAAGGFKAVNSQKVFDHCATAQCIYLSACDELKQALHEFQNLPPVVGDRGANTKATT